MDARKIFEYIQLHFIEENAAMWFMIAQDVAQNYTIHYSEGGVIATKEVEPGVLFFLEAKSPETPKGIWVFKMLRILARIERESGVKRIFTHTKNERVKKIMESRGWRSKEQSELMWEISYENI